MLSCQWWPQDVPPTSPGQTSMPCAQTPPWLLCGDRLIAWSNKVLARGGGNVAVVAIIVCVSVTPLPLLPHPPTPPTGMSDDEWEGVLTVTQEDFLEALEKLTPSVSAEELQRYKDIKKTMVS